MHVWQSISKTSPFSGRALTLCVCTRALAALRLEPTLDYNVRAIVKNDLPDFMVYTPHPTPHCVSNVKLKRGVGPEHWKRDPSEPEPRGPAHWRQGPEEDPRGPEHWKQVVESGRMFETMMQEALQDWAIHAITTRLDAAKSFFSESRL